jgi:hypothetical protein
MSYGRGSLHCLCEWGAQGWHNEKFPHQAGLLASTKKKKKKKKIPCGPDLKEGWAGYGQQNSLNFSEERRKKE